jgi:hypothetical protein
MYYGLGVLVEGAVVAVVATLPCAYVFWRATAPMRGGSRALRGLVIALASYGVMLLAAGIYGLTMVRPGYADNAVAGASIAGGMVATLLFLVLLLVLPRRAGDGA